jgi:predicted amidohydrolase YtcJ
VTAPAGRPGDWIVGAAFNGGLLAQMSSTQALALLDQASGDHPVILRDDSFHNRWVNSEVLRRAQLDASSTPPPGGFCERCG